MDNSALLGGGILDGLVSAGAFASKPESFKSDNDPQKILLSKIHPWKNQPRCYFSEESINTLTESFKKHGFKGVLVVRPHPEIDGDFQLVAGERRYLAAKKASLLEAYCFIGEFNDVEALDFALRENLNREDLSRLEETLGILKLIQTRHSLSSERVVEIVGKEGHGDKLARSNVTPSRDLADIISVLSEFEIELSSFRSNYLPTLKLQEPLRIAHLEQGLSYLKAESLNRIKETDVLVDLLAEVLENNLSVRVVRERVGEALTALVQDKSISIGKVSKQDKEPSPAKLKRENSGQCVLDLKSVVLTLSKAKYRKAIESDPKKKRKIQAAVKTLEALLEDTKDGES